MHLASGITRLKQYAAGSLASLKGQWSRRPRLIWRRQPFHICVVYGPQHRQLERFLLLLRVLGRLLLLTLLFLLLRRYVQLHP